MKSQDEITNPDGTYGYAALPVDSLLARAVAELAAEKRKRTDRAKAKRSRAARKKNRR